MVIISPEIQEILKQKRKKEWELLLRNDIKLRIKDHLARVWTPSLTELEKESLKEFDPKTNKGFKINYNATVQENENGLNIVIAKLGQNRIVSPYKERESGYYLPFTYQGDYIDYKGKEEFRAEEVNGPDYVPVSNDDIEEEFKKDETGNIVYQYADKVVDHNYTLKGKNEKFHGDPILADGRRWVRQRIGVFIIIQERKKETSFEINDWKSFEQYKIKTYPELPPIIFESPPFKIGTSGKEIWTYDQFKRYVLDTYPRDYLRIKRKGGKDYEFRVEPNGFVPSDDEALDEQIVDNLPDGRVVVRTLKSEGEVEEVSLTFLASFIEEYLKTEPLGTVKNHLIKLLKQMEFDFKKYQPVFWEKISKYVILPPVATVPTALVHPDIQSMVNDLDAYMTFLYSEWPDPDDFAGYMATRWAILKEYEFLLRELYFRYLKNPRLFSLSNKLVTEIVDNYDTGHNLNKHNLREKNRKYQTVNEASSAETPIKSAIAENIKEFGAYKAQLVRSESRDTTTDIANEEFEKNVGGNRGNERKTGRKTITKEFDPIDNERLNWVSKALELFLVYKDIPSRLNKFFFFSFEISRNLGYEDEDDEEY